MALTPDFSLIVDGSQDITTAVKNRLVSLEIVDKDGIDADSLTIVLIDDAALALPREGAMIDVQMGYVGQLSSMGRFVVDSTALNGPPDTMTITAHAADMQAALKVRRTRAWENIGLAAVLDTIAGSSGLQAVLHVALQYIVIKRMDQVNESDIHFLTRVARQYHAIFKVAMGRLMLLPINITTNGNGDSLPVISLLRRDLTQHDIKTAGRRKWHGAKAKWHDLDAATTHTITDGAEPYNVHPRTFATNAEAAAAVKTMRTNDDSIAASGSISLAAGDVRLMVGTLIALDVRRGLPDRWHIKRASHTLTGDGGFVSVCDISA